MQSYRFEDLRATIALCGGNSHLGDDFDDAFVDRFDVVLESRSRSVDTSNQTGRRPYFELFRKAR